MQGATTQRLEDARILVVEDHYALARLVQRALEAAGAEVLGPCPSLQRAFQTSADESFDCAVLDVNLAGELVFPLADHLRERNIPFILATGYDETIGPREYANCPRLAKPFEEQALIDRVSKLLNR